MHEMSLTRSLLTQVQQLCEQYGGLAVERIEVELGPLSGVEPILLREAYDVLSVERGIAGAVLEIQEVPLEARCRDCRAEFELASFTFICPECESRSVQVTRGDAFRLLNVTLQTAVADDHSGDGATQLCGECGDTT